ncbi:MAG: nicotinate (nicotinamide) nucleotide adenylyltransferase [Candidatus Yanofskybacteria bacterium]|nr:nicotinate (nicotinamide) nucleotide adenylyltransferase [Candidatus Yanofskybacteria bacterium]
MKNKKVALYGGSFSPPHLGHASVIEALLRLFPCDEIWVMLSADRKDKQITADGKNRIKMLELMINELFPDAKIPILISDFELKLNKPTATYETLRLLKEKYPDHTFNFVLGSDNLRIIETEWVNGERLFQEADFLALKNPLIPLPKKLPPHITILNDVAWTNISSTFVRKLIAQGHSGIPYLTKGVAEYIKSNSLYK